MGTDQTRVSIANAKGGVGKTTVAVNLGAALSERGHDVLIADLDPQGNALEALGLTDHYDDPAPNLYDVLAGSTEAIDDLVLEHDEMDVLPSNVDLLASERLLTVLDIMEDVGDPELREQLHGLADMADDPIVGERSEGQLAAALDRLDGYDVVIVDTPPYFGGLFETCLFAAPNIVVPSLTEASSQGAVELLYDQIAAFEQETGVRVDEVAAVANRVDPSTNESERMLTWLQTVYGEDVPLYQVPSRVDLQYSYEKGVSVLVYSPNSDVADVFRQLAETVEEQQKIEVESDD